MADLRKGYWVHLLPAERSDGSLVLTLIARRTYRIAVDSLHVVPLDDDAQPPLLDQDRCDEGKPEVAPPTLEMELVPEKAKVDVIVLGKAYAPGGKAVPAFECAVQLGGRTERLRICGPRKAIWQAPRKEGQAYVPQPPRFTEPEPIKELPLSYRHAYGGKSWWIQDEEALRLAAKVQPVLDADQAERKAQLEAQRKAKQQAAAQQAKESQIQAMFAQKDGDARAREERLRLGDGSEGFDHEGVRLAGAAASKDGTAILTVDELERQDLAEMLARQRAEDAAADARARAAAQQQLRQNAAGEWVEADEGVAILTDTALAEARVEAEKQQAAATAALEAAARRRAREQVERDGGTRVLDLEAVPDGDPDTWPVELKDALQHEDTALQKARDKADRERRKAEEEALSAYPQLPCPTNPFGKGFCLSNHKAVLQRTELPQIEHPDALLTPHDLVRDVARLDTVPMAYGLGTFPRHARPRVDAFGLLPSTRPGVEKALQDHQRSLDLDDPEQVRVLQAMGQAGPLPTLRPAFYNAASAQMQWPELRGDEAVTLTNLTPDGTLYFKLPAKVLTAEVDRGRGIERQPLRLDTLVIDAEGRQVSLLWRTQFALGSWDELATYPHLVGWVLDLDVEQHRAQEWADRLKAARGEGTAVLDLNAMPLESEPYLPQPNATAQTDEHGVLLLPKEGSYLRASTDDQWVKDAAAGVRDLDAEDHARRQEAAYQARKQAALQALAEQDAEDAARRKQVAEAIAAGKPVPPKPTVQGAAPSSSAKTAPKPLQTPAAMPKKPKK